MAEILKENKIQSAFSNDKELNLRLKYYGIEEDKTHLISLKPLKTYDKKLDILYFNKNISLYYVNVTHKAK